MEKMKVNKKLGALLDEILENTSKLWLFEVLSDWKNVTTCTQNLSDLHHEYHKNPLFISTAIIVGYEVELSKEDKVREVIKNYCNGVEVSQWVIDDIKMIYEDKEK